VETLSVFYVKGFNEMAENFKTKLVQYLKTQLDVPATDPDEQRRSRLLNIFLAGFFVCSILGIVAAVVGLALEANEQEAIILGLWASVASVIFTSLTFALNRYGVGKLARFLFLLFLTVTLIFSDTPEAVVGGSTLLAFAIPIILASVLFPPYASFIAAGAVGAATTGLTLYMQLVPDPFAVIIFFIVALAAWLAARSMQRAMRDLRVLNKELDQRVQDRTHELTEVLTRESATAMRNKTILESIADGVLVFNANQEAIMANPAANRLAQRDLQSVNLTEFLATIETKARESIQTWLMGQRPNGLNNVKFEWNERTISANVAPVMLPIANEKQTNAGNVMVLRDFTKEAELEQAKNLFLGMVSHELKTPMAAIQGYVNVLLDRMKGQVSEEDYEYLHIVDVSTKQLLKLANELIDLSRLETDQIYLSHQWLDLAAVANNAAKVVQQEFDQRNLSLEVNLADDLPDMYLDPDRIMQVLLNLLSNAYKYTTEGGATLTVSQADDWVYITVSDTGVGIKTVDQESLFERFFRASDRTVQKAGGTGLGLNISKGLVELHGGKLAFTSEYGVGTTFTITLPKNNTYPK
jgi:signal transduction histidine kinase